MVERAAEWEAFIGSHKEEHHKNRAETLSWAQSMAAPAGGSKTKVPLPSKYKGGKGDPAFTFLAACNNYRKMDPNTYPDNPTWIRWMLQQMEDKAGRWAVRQLIQADNELNQQGRPPKELRKWQNFGKFFLDHFGDPGLVEKAKNTWKQGLNQNGKAVDYFKKVEDVLIHLAYDRDSGIVLDQVMLGLKPHIKTHFIGHQWATLNDMKAVVIPYDSMYWEINNSTWATGEKTWTQQASGSKAPTNNQEHGKSQTPNIKLENAKTSVHFLPQEEFEECKKNQWCFICKKEGKKVVGLL